MRTLTDAQKAQIKTKKATRNEMDLFYGLVGSLNYLLYAVGNKEHDAEGEMVKRARCAPGCLMHLRCAESHMETAVRMMMETFDADKRASIRRHLPHLMLKTQLGKSASKDPETRIITIDELGYLVKAATEPCNVRLCPAGECTTCELGRFLDKTSFVTRGDRAWHEVFAQAARKDVFAEDGQ